VPPLRLLIGSLLACVLALAPMGAWAQETAPEGEEPEAEEAEEAEAAEAAEEAEAAEAPPPAPQRVDGLGRPFPDPLILERAKGQTIGGLAMAATGGAAMLTGLFVGSAVAREEISLGTPEQTGVILGATFGVGTLLLATGIPTMSTGTFTTKQLNRTIKGAEKVPRTVANEQRYWTLYGQRQAGQTMTVGGGGSILLGVVGIAAVVATIDTEFYRPEAWAGVGGTFGAGAGMIVAGILLQRDADQRMEALKKEVDPYYKDQAALPPRLRPVQIDPRELIPLPNGSGVTWAFRF